MRLIPRWPFVTTRSIENPNVPLSAPDAWTMQMYGGTSTSGVAVTPDTALGYSPVWRSLVVLSSDCGRLPIGVYRRTEGAKERATDHPAWRLLRTKAAPYLTANRFRRAMLFTAAFLGNSYARIHRSARTGEPVELEILATEHVTPVRDGNGVVYRYEDASGAKATYNGADVFHLAGQTMDGLTGISILERARDSFGIGLAADDFTARFFANGSHMKTYLEHPTRMNAAQLDDFRRQWRANFAGTKNAGNTPILMDGMKANSVATTNTEAQLSELKDAQVRQISNWFGVPPHKLGDPSRTSFNSLEQENQAYLDQALDPWLVAFEVEAADKLLTSDENSTESVVVEFNREAIISVDFRTKTGALGDLFRGGLITRDEARNKLNMSASADGRGRAFLQDLNQVWTDAPAPPAAAPPTPDTDAARAALTDGLGDAVAGWLGVAANEGRRQADVAAWCDGPMRDRLAVPWSRRVMPLVRSLEALAGVSATAADTDRWRARACDLVQDALTADAATGAVRDRLAGLAGTIGPLITGEILELFRGDFNGITK